jgi:hypothetical protein
MILDETQIFVYTAETEFERNRKKLRQRFLFLMPLNLFLSLNNQKMKNLLILAKNLNTILPKQNHFFTHKTVILDETPFFGYTTENKFTQKNKKLRQNLRNFRNY